MSIWSTKTGQRIRSLEHERATAPLAISPDGSQIAAKGGDKTLAIWNSTTGERIAVFRGHAGQIGTIAYSQDGTRIITGDQYEVRVWAVPSRTSVAPAETVTDLPAATATTVLEATVRVAPDPIVRSSLTW